jgi:hypothetical protein
MQTRGLVLAFNAARCELKRRRQRAIVLPRWLPLPSSCPHHLRTQPLPPPPSKLQTCGAALSGLCAACIASTPSNPHSLLSSLQIAHNLLRNICHRPVPCVRHLPISSLLHTSRYISTRCRPSRPPPPPPTRNLIINSRSESLSPTRSSQTGFRCIHRHNLHSHPIRHIPLPARRCFQVQASVSLPLLIFHCRHQNQRGCGRQCQRCSLPRH